MKLMVKVLLLKTSLNLGKQPFKQNGDNNNDKVRISYKRASYNPLLQI